MAKGILGKKIGMTQLFNEEGQVFPVTVIEAGPCYVVQKKTVENEGYNAIQVGFGEIREKLVNKPMKGHFAKGDVKPLRCVKEFKVDDIDAYEIGQEVKVDLFAAGEKVDVAGISKGKGFAGSIKRHGYSRGPMTHGSHYHRGGGSLGAMGPARVFKGTKMPGRMGNDKVTIQNLEVFKADIDKNLLVIKGAVPGAKGSLVTVKDSVKA